MKKFLLCSLVLFSVFAEASAQNSVSVDLTNKLLVNPDFEYVDISTVSGVENVVEVGDDTSIFSLAYNKVPYGWLCNVEEFGGTSRGVNADVSNPHGHAACWFNQSTFPVGWKLYQTIPADKLEPGLYKVSCLLWVEFGRKGKSNENTTTKEGLSYAEKMGACCLFANNNVQYYGMKRDYNKNLTSTDESVTYANYVPGTGGKAKMRPMVVYVNVKEGEDLSLGIRTASVDSAGAVRGNGAGWFRTDYFRIEKVLAQPDETPDEFTQKTLVNHSFELDPDGNVTTQQIAMGDSNPYGWYKEGVYDDYGIHPNFCWALEGGNACWINSKAIPMSDFALYQEISSDNLVPGVYEISCRLWQPMNMFGQCRLYGANGDKTYVQYYGSESQYRANLTEGEVNTFAEYPGWSDAFASRDRQLHEMWVDVPVRPEQNLELGIKSGGYDVDGNNTTKMLGQFHVDYFRVYKKENLPVLLEDKSANTIFTTDYNVRTTLKGAFKNNVWNTICLPFSLNASDIKTIFGIGARVAALEKVVNNVPTFNSVETIEAGVPYIIMPTDVIPSPMVIDDVQITASEPKIISIGEYSFCGVFNPLECVAGDSDKLLVTSDGKLEKPHETSALDSFKAFFTSTSTTPSERFAVDGETTGIIVTKFKDASSKVVYNLAGQRVNSNVHGVIITDGKKIVRR